MTKSAEPTSVNAGEKATYTITVTNTGNADGATDVVDDYDQAHVQVSD